MDSIIRGFLVYSMLLIIAEAVQPALTSGDDAMTNSLLLVLTLFAVDIGLSLLKQRSDLLEKLVDDVPLVLVVDGQPIRERMRQARVDEADILAEARLLQGLERMDQIKFAVLERSGGISIIPKSQGAA